MILKLVSVTSLWWFAQSTHRDIVIIVNKDPQIFIPFSTFTMANANRIAAIIFEDQIVPEPHTVYESWLKKIGLSIYAFYGSKTSNLKDKLPDKERLKLLDLSYYMDIIERLDLSKFDFIVTHSGKISVTAMQNFFERSHFEIVLYSPHHSYGDKSDYAEYIQSFFENPHYTILAELLGRSQDSSVVEEFIKITKDLVDKNLPLKNDYKLLPRSKDAVAAFWMTSAMYGHIHIQKLLSDITSNQKHLVKSYTEIPSTLKELDAKKLDAIKLDAEKLDVIIAYQIHNHSDNNSITIIPLTFKAKDFRSSCLISFIEYLYGRQES